MGNIDSTNHYVSFSGNELYAARWWSMYLFARENALSSQAETGTIWQDKESYQKATFLGLKENALHKLIAKQISLVYYYPTLLGCLLGVLMINRIIPALMIYFCLK